MVDAKALLSVASCNADDNQTERNNDEEEKEHKVYTEAQLTRPDAAIAEEMNNPDLTTDLVFAFNRECRPMLRETVLVAACLALKDATAEA